MPKIAILIADGFEEIEAITVIDVLRRAELDVRLLGVQGSRARGSHGITVETDARLDPSEMFDAVVLPGGMPGAKTLRDDARVQELLKAHARAKKLCAAICAGPIALAKAGVLDGKHATCYPGHEEELQKGGAKVMEGETVVVDGNVVTSRAPGTAMEFALTLVEKLFSPEKSREVARKMLVT